MKGRRPEPVPEGHVRIGQIVGPFGLKGAIKVASLTDFIERFDPGLEVTIGTSLHLIETSQWHKTQVRLKLSGIEDCDSAEKLRGLYLTAPESDRPELEEDEFVSADLIGLKVVEGEKELGVVENVVRSALNDLLKVGDMLIPAIRQFVKKVDLEAGVIEVELIEGMRPEDDAEEVR